MQNSNRRGRPSGSSRYRADDLRTLGRVADALLENPSAVFAEVARRALNNKLSDSHLRRLRRLWEAEKAVLLAKAKERAEARRERAATGPNNLAAYGAALANMVRPPVIPPYMLEAAKQVRAIHAAIGPAALDAMVAEGKRTAAFYNSMGSEQRAALENLAQIGSKFQFPNELMAASRAIDAIRHTLPHNTLREIISDMNPIKKLRDL